MLVLLLVAVLSIVGIKKVFFHSPLTDQSESLFHNIATPQEAPIPKAALRLRVIANSNSANDQRLKLQVRNAIVSKVGQLLAGAKTAAEAQAILTRETPMLQQVAMDVMREHGVKYPVQTELAKLAFPTKVYGNQVYPAGDYEALRIVLGAGKGANWWCVIYPPCVSSTLPREMPFPTRKVFRIPHRLRPSMFPTPTEQEQKFKFECYHWISEKKFGAH